MAEEIEPIPITGIGSWPGEDMGEALRITFDECPDIPYLPELPARGIAAGMIGRATALLSGLAVDLQPAGWRLTDGSGREHRLARSLMRTDLDQLEEAAQGYEGLFKFSVTGPWTLAASVERPRGDRVLADHGARRDLAQSLAEGLSQLLADMTGRLPGIQPILQLDEPLLPAVLAGTISTASGFSKHRTVSETDVSDTYIELIKLIGSRARVVTHCCAAGVPVELLCNSGFAGIAVDLDQLDTRAWDGIGVALENGVRLGAGVLPSSRALTCDQLAQRILKPLRQLGLDPAVAGRVVLTPACGLANRTVGAAVQSLRSLRTAAAIVTEELAE